MLHAWVPQNALAKSMQPKFLTQSVTKSAIKLIAVSAIFMPLTATFAMQNACSASSGAALTPVIELYTSQGCSSCPPADEWLSTLKKAQADGKVVAQAFHVNYWDYIGWTDKFAAPTHTTRQRQISAASGLSGIYTPQLVKNGLTVRDYERAIQSTETARAQLKISQTAPDSFEASVTPGDSAVQWSAYFTVTEHGHVSKVTAGENKGENLSNNFVVRQYVQLGSYSGAQTLKFSTLAMGKTHPRQVNLVVTQSKTGKPLQAISLGC